MHYIGCVIITIPYVLIVNVDEYARQDEGADDTVVLVALQYSHCSCAYLHFYCYNSYNYDFHLEVLLVEKQTMWGEVKKLYLELQDLNAHHGMCAHDKVHCMNLMWVNYFN